VAWPAVSQHLDTMLLGGLVGSRRDGRRVLYQAKRGRLRRVVVEALHTAEHQVTGAAEHDRSGPRGEDLPRTGNFFMLTDDCTR
jgi:DNA-binding transcriptional ArsR family regulator